MPTPPLIRRFLPGPLLAPSDVNLAITEAGLHVGPTEEVARLYAESLEWERANERWHEDRLMERGSKHSAQKVFRVIRDRLRAPGADLPSVVDLDTILQASPDKQSKAQVVYLYLLEGDLLARRLVHQVLSTQGLDRESWDLSKETLLQALYEIRRENEQAIPYTDASLRRWVSGIRSVFREIGVLENPRDPQGTTPLLEDIPLKVAAGYSWQKQGEEWQSIPLGWCYLFQSRMHWDVLTTRLLRNSAWRVSNRMGRTALELVDASNPFGLVRREG